MTKQEIVDRILAYHPAIPNYRGCDGWKWGDGQGICTGVAAAMVATMDVIRQADLLGANLLVVHEPTFYTSRDPAGWQEDFPNRVFQEKAALLTRLGISVWRDHDHMHAHRPDSIFTGVLRHLGWEGLYTVETHGPYRHYLITIPEVTLGELMDRLIGAIGLNGVRYIGDPAQKVRRVALVGHLHTAFAGARRADGTEMEYGAEVIRTLEEWADVILPGEVIDWTVLSYLRDAAQQGRPKAMINLGHLNWEELGMKYAQEWISGLVGDRVPVWYIPAGDLYRFRAAK